MPTLDWLNKKEALKTAGETPCKSLRPDADLSCGDTESGNMIIKGGQLIGIKSTPAVL